MKTIASHTPRDQLPDTLPGHYKTREGRDMLARYLNMTREELAGGHQSDTEVAFNTAMLMRADLAFEAFLSVAKDRIRWLSAQLAKRDAAQSALVEALTEIAEFGIESQDGETSGGMRQLARTALSLAKGGAE